MEEEKRKKEEIDDKKRNGYYARVSGTKPLDVKREKAVGGIFIDCLRAYNIRSVSFKDGLIIGELNNFLEMLCKRKVL